MNYKAVNAMVASTAVSRYHEYITGDVLDAGCGAQPYKRLFLVSGGFRKPVTSWAGLDIRPIADIEGDICQMPVDDATFDTVLCTDALQYTADPVVAFGEFARVLKPGGHLFLTCPNVAQEDEMAFWSFKARGLHALATTFGFDIVEQNTMSKLFEHEFMNFSNSEMGLSLPPEMLRWIGYLDTQYPAMNLVIARKQ